MGTLSAARFFRGATVALSVLGLTLGALGVALAASPATLAAGPRIALGVAGALAFFVALAVPLRVGLSPILLPGEIKSAMRVNGACIAAAGAALVLSTAWDATGLPGGGRALGGGLVLCGALALCGAWLGLFRLSARLPATFTVGEMRRIASSAGILGSRAESVADREFRRWSSGSPAGVPEGTPAPDGRVVTLGGEETTLSAVLAATGASTVVLNLGSYTCPHHRKRIDELHALVDRWQPRAVAFLTVYVTEAHPEDGWRLEGQYDQDEEYVRAAEDGRADDFCFSHARTIEDRLGMARWLVEKKELRTAIVVDAMEDELRRAYNAWPIRLYVLQGGRVAFRGDQGPFGYLPAAVDEALARLVPLLEARAGG
jgi:hypothetical protein